jgi:hypothetical protein
MIHEDCVQCISSPLQSCVFVLKKDLNSECVSRNQVYLYDVYFTYRNEGACKKANKNQGTSN